MKKFLKNIVKYPNKLLDNANDIIRTIVAGVLLVIFLFGFSNREYLLPTGIFFILLTIYRLAYIFIISIEEYYENNKNYTLDNEINDANLITLNKTISQNTSTLNDEIISVNADYQFLNYEICIDLKTLGFDGDCFGYYQLANNKKDLYFCHPYESYSHNSSEYLRGDCTAVLIEQALDFLEQKYHVAIEVCMDETMAWIYRISPLSIDSKIENKIDSPNVYSTRKQALIAGIEDLIERLIK